MQDWKNKLDVFFSIIHQATMHTQLDVSLDLPNGSFRKMKLQNEKANGFEVSKFIKYRKQCETWVSILYELHNLISIPNLVQIKKFSSYDIIEITWLWDESEICQEIYAKIIEIKLIE